MKLYNFIILARINNGTKYRIGTLLAESKEHALGIVLLDAQKQFPNAIHQVDVGEVLDEHVIARYREISK